LGAHDASARLGSLEVVDAEPNWKSGMPMQLEMIQHFPSTDGKDKQVVHRVRIWITCCWRG
jgi:hypothetical protein